MKGLRLFLLAWAFALAGGAAAAGVDLSGAWLRPAAAGASARLYVDIASDDALTLTGGSTTAATSVEIVVVEKTDGREAGKVVKTFAIPAGQRTRFAYLGNYLRLVDVARDLGTGAAVPLTLEFVDAAGNPHVATTTATVHGLMLPHVAPPAAEGKRDPGPDAAVK